jgi:hypothetical protein
MMGNYAQMMKAATTRQVYYYGCYQGLRVTLGGQEWPLDAESVYATKDQREAILAAAQEALTGRPVQQRPVQA